MKKHLKKITNWRAWVRGVVGGFVGGASNAVTVMVIKPEDFNFSTGWPALWQFALISGLISAALYLKTTPLPPQEIVEDDEAPLSSEKPNSNP